jgi:hypothetical protein
MRAKKFADRRDLPPFDRPLSISFWHSFSALFQALSAWLWPDQLLKAGAFCVPAELSPA